jgi:hypothetical protein
MANTTDVIRVPLSEPGTVIELEVRVSEWASRARRSGSCNRAK